VVGSDVPFPGDPKKWEDGFKITKQMFDEAGIVLDVVTGFNNDK